MRKPWSATDCRTARSVGKSAAAANEVAACDADPRPSDSERSRAPLRRAAATLAAVAALWAVIGIAPTSTSIKAFVSARALGVWRSGFLATASLVLFSELGDRSFFIAGLMAMQVGKWVAYVGAVSALAVMSSVSAGIGIAFGAIPDAVKSSVPTGEWLATGMLLFFGLTMLYDALKAPEDGSDTELAGAREVVDRSEDKVRVGGSSLRDLAKVASLISVAEWGDRSMLATIAMAATRDPVAVAVGATVGHMVASAIAVLAGSWASRYVSERLVKVVGGGTFLVFALGTALSAVFGFG